MESHCLKSSKPRDWRPIHLATPTLIPALSIDEEAITEGREEMLEQLKALGYIQ